MKRFLLFLFLGCFSLSFAGNRDIYLNANAGCMHMRGMNLSVGMEKEFRLYDAVEIYLDVYNQPSRCPLCDTFCKEHFWKNYYSISLGANYKWLVYSFPRQSFRFITGADCGIGNKRLLGSLEMSLEYRYQLSKRFNLVLKQKNDFHLQGHHGKEVKYFNGMVLGIQFLLNP